VSNRNSLAVVLGALFVGYRSHDFVGPGGIAIVLGLGYLAFFLWTFIASRRGETVSWMQKSHG